MVVWERAGHDPAGWEASRGRREEKGSRKEDGMIWVVKVDWESGLKNVVGLGDLARYIDVS